MLEEDGKLDKVAAPAQFYANTARIEATVYDFGFVFGVMSNGESNDTLVVRMSPQHAKSVEILLTRFLAAYEREVGAVVLPEKLVTQLSGEEAQDASDSSQ